MMTNEDIIDLVREYVLEILSDKLSDNMSFHNVMHTQEVVKAAIEIARECDFTPKQFEIIILAAWFHDCGYTTAYHNHEDSSKAIAKNFLNKYGYAEEDLEQVLNSIEATRFPQNPKSPEAEVLADADLYHFTRPDYTQYEQRLRKEFGTYLCKTYTDMEWAKTNYTLLSGHHYYTSYGKSVLQKFKEVNVKRLKEKLHPS